MSKPRSELSKKQHHAISTLITAPTIADAAWQADVGVRTLHRWLTQPAFQAELRVARSRVFCHAFGHLQQVASLAVDTLDRAMHDKNASPASRVSAARAALRFACHGIEIADFEERLAALEQSGSENDAQEDAPEPEDWKNWKPASDKEFPEKEP